MKIWKCRILSAIAMTFGVAIVMAQTISPELQQQAAAMGYSEAAIRAQMGRQSTTANNTTISPQTANGQTSRVQQQSTIPTMQGMQGQGMDDTQGLYILNESRLPLHMMTFGQDLFRNSSVSFEPNINIPTPKDYQLTSGDEVVITIWGDTELLYKETISPDGVINVPNYGPVNLSGMRVEDAQRHLESRLSRVYNSLGSSSQLMLSVGQIGSIKVNVSGEVMNPGTYTLSSLANIFHILHLSGGTTDIGNMRKIELYRNSKLVTTVDIYDYILNGNANGNTVLKDGDVVVVKPYDVRAYAAGEVKRPMYYQLKEGESIADFVNYFGGFNDRAFKGEVKIYRNNGSDREIVMVDRDNFGAMQLIDGDSVLISRANNEFKNIISINGAVWRGGDFQFDEQTNTLSTLIEKAGGLMGDAFATRGIITRRNPDYTTSMLSFVTTDVTSGEADVALQNYDKVYIPKIDSLRESYNVVISGEVNIPITMNYHEGMRIEDAIIMAGGLKESASLATLDVTRRTNDKNSMEYADQIAETYNFQINEDLTLNSTTSDFVLEPFDVIVVRKSPQFEENTSIYIMGEVLFPGVYSLTNNRTYLSDVINMAKGTTPHAYLKGTSLTRRSISSRSTMDSENDNSYFTESDISNMALNTLAESIDSRDTLTVSTSDIKIYSVGVDMEKAMADPHGDNDILLQENDIVLIPKQQNVINVIGAVYYPNATSYSSDKLKHYINESGGFNKSAVRRPFVIYQNGKVATTKSFIFKRRPKIEPGALVVVPSKGARERASLAETISAVSSMASVASSISTLGVAIAK